MVDNTLGQYANGEREREGVVPSKVAAAMPTSFNHIFMQLVPLVGKGVGTTLEGTIFGRQHMHMCAWCLSNSWFPGHAITYVLWTILVPGVRNNV